MKQSRKSQTIQIWKTSLKTLRMIHAYTGESLVKILDRLLHEELERLEQQHDDSKKHD